MEIIKLIKLNDGTTHDSVQKAQRHLSNSLSSGKNLDLFEQLSNTNVLRIQEIFIDSPELIGDVLKIVKELHELSEVKI